MTKEDIAKALELAEKTLSIARVTPVNEACTILSCALIALYYDDLRALRERAERAEQCLAKAKEALDIMLPIVEAAKEFVAKVERGEARSKRSYAAFKVPLDRLEELEKTK